ncbi:MAG: hypothetical protein ACP5SH_25335 [Syntrophobacteraceae bacterium]
MSPKSATAQPDVLIPQSTGLVTTSHTEAGLPGLPEELGGFTGLEGLDASSFVIPRFKIVQPTSKEGTPGTLRINLTGDEFASLPIILVKAIQGRVLWDPDQKNDKALCRSYDFLTPDPSIESPFSPVCAKKVLNLRRQEVLTPVCPQAKWNKDSKGKDVKPECNETYNLLCLQAEDFLPFWIALGGASIAPVKRYLSAIALRRSRLFAWETILTAEERKEPNRHYVASFSAPRPLDPERAAFVAQTIVDLGLASVDIRRTFEAEEAAAADSAGESDSSESTPEPPSWLGK